MDVDAELRRLLSSDDGAIVAALGAGGRIVPVPASVPVWGHRRLEGVSGIDLVIAGDQVTIIEAWARAQSEPVVEFEVHLLARPDRASVVHIFDVRAEHGVHVVVAEGNDLADVERATEIRAAMRRPVGHAKRDSTATFLEVDEATTKLLGWTADELVGRSTIDFVHPEDVERAIDGWMQLRNGSATGRAHVRLRHARGHYIWIEVTNENHLEDPALGCVLSELVDISEEMEQLEALRTRERLLARLAEALPIGICHLRPDREVLYSNQPLVELLGVIDSIDALLGRVAPLDRYLLEAALDRGFRGGPGNLEVAVAGQTGDLRCEFTVRAMAGEDGAVDGVIVCAADVTDRSRLRAELEHRASHDALTDCLNRGSTATAVERLLTEGRTVAVAFVDLDDFKAINDAIGHAAGDELLRVAAARLRAATRAEDVLGRVGGDEFLVVCAGGTEVLDPDALADRLTRAVNGDVRFSGRRIPLRASVGAAVSVEGELDAEALMHRADVAMYSAKRKPSGKPAEV